jgi:hypothetical protein
MPDPTADELKRLSGGWWDRIPQASPADPGLACCENEVIITGPTGVQKALHESAEGSKSPVDAGGLGSDHHPNQGTQSNHVLGLTRSDRFNNQVDNVATQGMRRKLVGDSEPAELAKC